MLVWVIIWWVGKLTAWYLMMHRQHTWTGRLELMSSNATLVGKSAILLYMACKSGEHLGIGVVSGEVCYCAFWFGSTMSRVLFHVLLVWVWSFFCNPQCFGVVKVEASCTLDGSCSTFGGELACSICSSVSSFAHSLKIYWCVFLFSQLCLICSIFLWYLHFFRRMARKEPYN